MKKEVVLHVYDVTNSGSEKTNNTILHINRIFKDRIGLGGIFHSAVQVYENEEWSFGFCEHGSGVFSCPPRENPMYTYRESIVLGETNCSILKVNQILRQLSREWPGDSYHLLAKNCNHFCDAFCERLGVPKLPAWVNRFANAGDTAIVVAGNTAERCHGLTISTLDMIRDEDISLSKGSTEPLSRFGTGTVVAYAEGVGPSTVTPGCYQPIAVLHLRQAKKEIVTASKVAYRFMAGLGPNSSTTPESSDNSNRGSPMFQGAWFKNLASIGAKPSSNAEEFSQENGDEYLLGQISRSSDDNM